MKLIPSSLFLLAPLAAHADGAAPSGPGGLASFAPLAVIMVLFYFLLIRPQQKQAREQQRMLDSIKKGDRVLTQGGLYATVSAIKGKAIELKLSEEVKVLAARSAVTQVVQGDPAAEVPEVVSK
jgi:preprotein translocase subunit YajC